MVSISYAVCNESRDHSCQLKQQRWCKAARVVYRYQLITILLTEFNRERQEQERNRIQAISALNMTQADLALFTSLHYGFVIPSDDLPQHAVDEYHLTYCVLLIKDDCRRAMAKCLVRGWLQIIDKSAQTKIAHIIRQRYFLRPVYGGIPDIGCVDFTSSGAEVWQQFNSLCDPGANIFPYEDAVCESTSHYFRTLGTAVAAMKEFQDQADCVSSTGPIRVGPWRAQWWRRFPGGYRVDVEERRKWQGRCAGGDELCYFDRNAVTAGIDQLKNNLDLHNVTLAEWLCLSGMEDCWFHTPASCGALAHAGKRRYGINCS